MQQFITFFRNECPDRVNGIQTICNGLSASRLNLQVVFVVDELVHIIKPLFTGVLHIGGYFLTRGLALSKKAVKHDCFERAVEILRTYALADIIALEDCGAEALREEVKRQSMEDPEAFKVFLGQKQASEAESIEKIRTAATMAAQSVERNFPLSDKMMMLVNELDKQKGASEEEPTVSLASRLDVLCFKVGISVATLYRVVNLEDSRQYNEQPFKGDTNVNLICEIYFDKVKVGQAQGQPRKNAQLAAYENLFQRLEKDPIALIVRGTELPENPECLADYFEICYKGAKPQEGNNANRLYSLKMFPPANNLSPEDLVIMESDGDSIEENAYKILEFSASRNGMLLEWKQLDQQNKSNVPQGFRCELTLCGQKTVVGVASSKHKARNTAAALMLMDLYQTQDVIGFHAKENTDKAVSFQEICNRAEELKKEVPARAERVDCWWPEEKKDIRVADKEEIESTIEEILTTAKAWRTDPARLWIEDAIVELMEKHIKKVTSEEVLVGPSVSSALRRFCLAAARACQLQCSVRSGADPEWGPYLCIGHRGLTVQEMVKILHVNKGQSGRYKLLCNNKPFTIMQQAQFVRSFPDLYTARVSALNEAEKLKKV